jgi:hypothetical protein
MIDTKTQPVAVSFELPLGGHSRIALSTGRAYTIIARKPKIPRLSHTHLRFANDSALAVPAPWTNGHHPLAALARAAHHLEAQPGTRLVIAGHSSAAGSGAHNQKLSQDRADGIMALIRGDCAGWVETATRSGSIQDVKAYLTYLKERRGWRCDPGRINLEVDHRTRAGVEAFQIGFNDRFAGDLQEDGVCGRKTLGALFQVQYFELERWLGKLGLTPDRLHADEITVLAAGSQYAGKVDTLQESESADRIVDLLFLGPKSAGEAPLTAERLYGGLFGFSEIQLGDVTEDWEYGSLLIVTDLTTEDTDLDERYHLTASDGTFAIEQSVSTRGIVRNGGIELVFDDLPTSATYTLRVISNEGAESIVFRDVPYPDFHQLSTTLPSEMPAM